MFAFKLKLLLLLRDSCPFPVAGPVTPCPQLVPVSPLDLFQHLSALAPSQYLLRIGPTNHAQCPSQTGPGTHPGPHRLQYPLLASNDPSIPSELVPASSPWAPPRVPPELAHYPPRLGPSPAPAPGSPPAPGGAGRARGVRPEPGAWPAAGRAARRCLPIGLGEGLPTNGRRPGGVAAAAPEVADALGAGRAAAPGCWGCAGGGMCGLIRGIKQ